MPFIMQYRIIKKQMNKNSYQTFKNSYGLELLDWRYLLRIYFSIKKSATGKNKTPSAKPKRNHDDDNKIITSKLSLRTF